MVEPLDIYKVNIFDNYMHMKIWGQMFSKACGREIYDIKPNTELLDKLTRKFIEDYNNKKENNG